MPDRLRPLTSLALALALAGCVSVGPDYQRPSLDLPQAWNSAPGANVPGARWWTVFNDAALDALVDEALANSPNLLIAAARVDEARAQLGISDADRYPAVYAQGARSRTRTSSSTATVLPPGTPLETNDVQATLNASYELDLWGKYRRASEAARADLLASEAARETVRISLTSQVAQSYFALTALDAQVEATKRTLDARRESLALQSKRFDAGVISEFDLRQLEAEVAAAEAQLPSLERSRAAQESALAVILGRSPRAVLEGALARGSSTTPAQVIVPDGLPSDLLLRRPDIVETEQRLVAANARIGAARAAYFPAISLTGYLGSESASLADLFSGPARIWQLAGALTQPIFQAGRIGFQVDAAKAREQQALVTYRDAVASAFRDVRDALNAQTRAQETLAAETRRVEALTQALKFARLRYQNGVASQLDVLDAERNLLSAELNRIDAERTQRTAVSDLFKALGGGWQGPLAQVGAAR